VGSPKDIHRGQALDQLVSAMMVSWLDGSPGLSTLINSTLTQFLDAFLALDNTGHQQTPPPTPQGVTPKQVWLQRKICVSLYILVYSRAR
jgi:hypothetical protein